LCLLDPRLRGGDIEVICIIKADNLLAY
jgi:hypothetical protein